MDNETRTIMQPVELRKLEDGTEVLSGYAIVFNQESEDLGGFVETIERSSTEGVDFSDTVSTFNHDANNVLGRVPKTMTYSVDERGIKVDIYPPDTTTGRDVKELVRRGDVKGMSFTFRIKKDGDKWEKPKDARGLYHRTISAFEQIPELGPVVFPAYRATDISVAKRELGMLKDIEERESTDALELERAKKELEREKVNNYHRELKLKIRSRLIKK
jgi:HK97 family phage prohead protease